MKRPIRALLVIGLAACAADEPPRGGGLVLDASSPVPPAGYICTKPARDTHTFTDLYADYFGFDDVTGGPAKASCSLDPGCHRSADSTGAIASNGFVCGAARAACYAGLTGAGADLVGTKRPGQDPTQTGLYLVLRKTAPMGSNKMPKRNADPKSFFFCEQDMARINAWLAAGAPDD